MHEASLYDQNCFVTLTYGRNQLPPHSSLCHEDFQRFMKRLRYYAPNRVRYYMCGEYGPLNHRPHYHACLFGIDFHDRKPAGKSESGAEFFHSDALTSIWSHGKAAVQDLNNRTANYCARYIMTKRLGRDALTAYQTTLPDGTVIQRRPEYADMSQSLGKRWLELYRGDVYPHDYVISRNAKRRPPKAYDRMQLKHDPAAMEQLQYERELRARPLATENTPERLAVQEQVHQAKIAHYSRHLE